jgi:hypothetical protein
MSHNVLTGFVNVWRHRRKIQVQTQEMRSRAQQTRQRAAQASQETAMSCEHALMMELRQSMPDATAMTRAITAMILVQHGLLGGTTRPKHSARR